MSRSTVITVNFNGASDTAACVESLRKSKDPVSIVIVDNTPNDLNLTYALQERDNIKLLQASENLGFGRGNNLGIDWVLQYTDSEFILLLNNDAKVMPDTIQKIEKAMDEHPEVGIVTARIALSEDPSVLWYGGGEVDWKRGGGYVPGVLGPIDAKLAMHSRYVTFASGCVMAIRRSVLEKLGGFDKRYFMYDEDLELSLRTVRNGWLIWYESSALVLHKGQGSLRRKQGGRFMGAWSPNNPNLPFYVYHIMKNRLMTMEKYAKGKHRMEFLLFFPLFILAKIFRFSLYRRWNAIAAMFNGWKDYRKELQKD